MDFNANRILGRTGLQAGRMGVASRALASRRFDVHRVNERILDAVRPET